MYYQKKFHINLDICFFCEDQNCACKKTQNCVLCFCKNQKITEHILEHFKASRKCFINFRCSRIKFTMVKTELKKHQKCDLIKLMKSENKTCLQLSVTDLSSYLTFILKYNFQIFWGGKNWKSILKNLETNICIVDFRSLDFNLYTNYLNKCSKLIIFYLIDPPNL